VHLIEITRDNPLRIAKGEYLVEDVNAGEMLAQGWGRVRQPDERCDYKVALWRKDRNERKILFVRPGGFGDLLFLTPTFAHIKSRWPECEIWLACFKRYHEILLHNPDVDGFIDYPVALSKWQTFDAHVWLENAVENERKLHAVDVIAQRAGVVLTDKRMRYVVTDDERAVAEKEFPREMPMHRIGLQMGGNQGNLLRMYAEMGQVSKMLWRQAHEVFLFGRPGDFKSNEPDGIVNLMQRNKTIRESCAILQTCDVVVAPDSVMAHVAGALDIPCIALYGAFPWQLRTAYAKKTFALQGRCPVSPCFHHVRPGTGLFPEFGPCALTGKCEAMAMISPERVVREVEKRLHDLDHYERPIPASIGA